jgi:transcriptional regulator with XRE-family HTH domain
MGRVSLEPSQEVARLLRDRRRELGWTLREVEERCRTLGRPVHFTTLARVERGEVDPGLRRLHVLFKIYDLPHKVMEDLLEVEEFAGDLPTDAPTARLYEDAVRDWKAGDLRKGLAGLATLRARVGQTAAERYDRQKSILAIAVAVGAIGRYRLSRHIVEELLLLEPPEPSLLVTALVQAAVCWHWLGSGDVALGLLGHAEAKCEPGQHRYLALVLHERAGTLASMGQPDESERTLERAITEYRAAGDTFGEAQAFGVRVRLCFDRGEPAAALVAAREAREHAKRHGYERLVVQRTIDEGRALFESGRREEGLTTLSTGLAKALEGQDSIAQFYGHHCLWKAYVQLGDAERAKLELNAASYFVQFVDAAMPEAREVRELRGQE